jgi:hypothetical protein
MHLKRGGKLEMGPLWDFDWAFGGTILNNNDKPEGFWIGKAASWYVRLFKWAQWGQAPLRPFVTFLVENLVVWIKMLTFVPLIQI